MIEKTCCVTGHWDIPQKEINHVRAALRREEGGTVRTIRFAHQMRKELREILLFQYILLHEMPPVFRSIPRK